MAVYPFYIDAVSSTRSSNVGVGTRRKDGTLNTCVYQRENGTITRPYYIEQYTEERDGVLKCITNVYYLGNIISTHITDY